MFQAELTLRSRQGRRSEGCRKQTDETTYAYGANNPHVRGHVYVCTQMNQIRARKRAEATAAKRAIGYEGSPPHLVVCSSHFQ